MSIKKLCQKIPANIAIAVPPVMRPLKQKKGSAASTAAMVIILVHKPN
jgi:hypothetical protein